MSYAPLTKSTKTYKGATYDFSITVKEDGVDLDLSQLDKVQVIMKNQGQTVFDYNNTDEGSLSLSGDNNETVSGTVSAETMKLPVQRRFYQELWLYFSDGTEDVYFVLTHEIIDETSGVSQGAHDYEIDIDTDAEQVTGGAASSLARTIEARDEAETSETNAAQSESNAATSETNAANSASAAATSETNAAASETESQDNADDAEKQAQNTSSFTDSDGNNFDKGAKGYAQDAEGSAQNADADAMQAVVDAHGYYTNELSNIKQRLRDLEA